MGKKQGLGLFLCVELKKKAVQFVIKMLITKEKIQRQNIAPLISERYWYISCL